MYNYDAVDLTYYNPFSRLFTLKEWVRVIIFYLLVILIYLYAIHEFVYRYHPNFSTYDPNFLITLAEMTFIELSTVLIFPLFYITYIIGKESRLVSSVRFSYAFIKLCMLYTIIFLLFLPEMYMYYQIFILNYNYIFNTSYYPYFLVGDFAVQFAYDYVLLLIFTLGIYIISAYMNRKHKKVSQIDFNFTNMNIGQNNQPAESRANINSITMNTKRSDQDTLTKDINISDQAAPPAKMFNEVAQPANNKEESKSLFKEISVKPKRNNFDPNYLKKTYFDEQEWLTIIKFYYVVLLLSLVLTFAFSLFASLSNNNIYEFFRWEDDLFLITIIVYFVFPFIYSFQNHQRKSLSDNIIIIKIILILLFALLIFSINNEFHNELYQSYEYSYTTVHSLVVVTICGIVGILAYSAIYHKKIDVMLSQYEEYAHLKAKFNLNYILYYKKTKNALLSSESADFLIKQFFLLQTNEIKSTLPELTPLNLRDHLKSIIEHDYDRLKKLCLYNGMKIKSDQALVDFAMTIAEPLIFSLEPVLRLQFTNLLLNKNNDLKLFHANADDLWTNVNTILLQWKSSLDESFKTNVQHY